MKKANFRQYKSMDLMMDIKTPYSINLNAEDQHINYDDRIPRMYKYYKKRLSKIHAEYSFNMEISTPLDGRDPRIHLHGIIYFDNYQQLKKWYEKDSMEIARSMHIDIDTISQPEEWDKYMTKNAIIMSHLTDNKYKIQSVGYTIEPSKA